MTRFCGWSRIGSCKSEEICGGGRVRGCKSQAGLGHEGSFEVNTVC